MLLSVMDGVIHGQRAVAELKPGLRAARRGGRGTVIHGQRAVAELKQGLPVDAWVVGGVIHGQRAVAELKRQALEACPG